MTRDEIIKLAIDAGLYSGNARTPGTEVMIVKLLQRFADLVAAAEREACAKICDTQHDAARTSPGAARANMCAERIRARGEKGQS